jgi:hypothetical protein
MEKFIKWLENITGRRGLTLSFGAEPFEGGGVDYDYEHEHEHEHEHEMQARCRRYA